MKDDETSLPEQLSALMDGSLDENDQQVLLAELKANPQLQATWQNYHLISHMLQRKCKKQQLPLNLDLHVRVRAQIDNEVAVEWGREFNTPIVMNNTQNKEVLLSERTSK